MQLTYVDLFDIVEGVKPQRVDSLKKERTLDSLATILSRRGIDSLLSGLVLDSRKVTNYMYVLKQVRERIIKPLLSDSMDLQATMDQLFEGTPYSIRLEDINDTYKAKKLFRAGLNNKNDKKRLIDEDLNHYCKESADIYRLTLMDAGCSQFCEKVDLSVIAPLKLTVRSRYADGLLYLQDKELDYVRNFHDVIAEIYLLSVIFRYFSKESNVESITRTISGYLNDYFSLTGSLTEVSGVEDGRYSWMDCDHKTHFPVLGNLLIDGVQSLTFEALFEEQSKKTLVRKYEAPLLTSFMETRSVKASLQLILSYILDDMSTLKTRYGNIGKASSDYAKIFETKKNIPKAILKEMENSKLNSIFGYVELDESTDLSKYQIVVNEILEFISWFELSDLSSYSVRFRRLGKHKANGLFYPVFRCLAVDVSTGLSSFVHEFFHLLDYHEDLYQLKSDAAKFSPIVYEYRRLVQKYVDGLGTEHPLSKQFYGKSKYNKSYLFDSSEIFARCGEIYLHRTLNVKSSLLKVELDEMRFPSSEKLNRLIENYYEDEFYLSASIERRDLTA